MTHVAKYMLGSLFPSKPLRSAFRCVPFAYGLNLSAVHACVRRCIHRLSRPHMVLVTYATPHCASRPLLPKYITLLASPRSSPFWFSPPSTHPRAVRHYLCMSKCVCLRTYADTIVLIIDQCSHGGGLRSVGPEDTYGTYSSCTWVRISTAPVSLRAPDQ